MLTQQQVIEAVRAGRKSACIDGRDYGRLTEFMPASEWPAFGFKVKDGVDPATVPVRPWTREEIISQLQSDVLFGIEKAEDQRGISSSLMVHCVAMWMWILEDASLQVVPQYDDYGLEYLQEVRSKYLIRSE